MFLPFYLHAYLTVYEMIIIWLIVMMFVWFFFTRKLFKVAEIQNLNFYAWRFTKIIVIN